MKSKNKTKQKQTHRHREQADGCQRRGGMGGNKTKLITFKEQQDSTMLAGKY